MPFCYFPEAVGGTEIYVRDLSREQQKRGHAVMILAPADATGRYEHDGLAVVRFAISNDVADISDLYSSRNNDITELVQAITDFGADVLHVHGVGRAVAPAALEALRAAGVRIVLTYHTPTTTCVRGTLLQHGAHPCDGALDARLCTACTLTSHGVPAVFASAIARAPVAAGNVLRVAGLRGRISTALRMRELVTLRHDQTRALLTLADAIVAPAEWVARLLHNLGVPTERVILSRQGIRASSELPARPRSDKLRVVFVGRLEAGKGVHLLTEALGLLRDEDIELHIYGVVQSAANRAYRAKLQNDSAHDPRVVMHDGVAADDVVRTIAKYDVLAAPSQQMETGPLVVLEAFAAGIPVIGSRLGGIAELVQDGVDGLLIDGASPRVWADAIGRLHADRELLRRLSSGVRPPRTITAVADDMDAVYERIA